MMFICGGIEEAWWEEHEREQRMKASVRAARHALKKVIAKHGYEAVTAAMKTLEPEPPKVVRRRAAK